MEVSSPIEVKLQATRIRGFVSKEDVANFLGIQYAQVCKRFCAAKRASYASRDGVINATAYGPRCPQPHNYGRDRRAHLYRGLMSPTSLPVSEFDCLNLNVFAPKAAVENNLKLPVLVWIHGGGWVFGDGGPEYDGNRLIQEARRIHQPFIVVTINYRLGYLGFLNSSELRSEGKIDGDRWLPNAGLHDQRLALEWVRDHIGNFGGDPENVTIAGQSAGGWSALSHVFTNEPLCRGVVAMSATVISLASESECQADFDHVVSRTGISTDASAKQKLTALREASVDDMTKWLDGSVLVRPSWDPSWFTCLLETRRLDEAEPSAPGVESILIGATKDETANIRPAWQRLSSDRIREALRTIFADCDLHKEMMAVYGLDEDADDERLVDGLVELTTESFFGLFPPQMGVKDISTFVYRFDQADIFQESAYHNASYHCLDLSFLFRHLAVSEDSACQQMCATSNAIVRAVASFVNGVKPWDSYRDSGQTMIFDGDRSGPVQLPGTQKWRRFSDDPHRLRVLVEVAREIMTFDFSQRG